MPDTPTWSLLEALRDRLATISTANGYRTDIGATVTLEPYQRQPDDGPMLTVVAVEMPVQSSQGSLVKSEVEISVEAHIPIATASGHQLAHQAAADIFEALGFSRQRELSLPAGCTGLTPLARRMLQPESADDAIVAQVTARAVLVERHVARTP